MSRANLLALFLGFSLASFSVGVLAQGRPERGRGRVTNGQQPTDKLPSDASFTDEEVNLFFLMMTSDKYTRVKIDCSHVSGDTQIYIGPFGPYNTLGEFVVKDGTMQAHNIAYLMDEKYGGLYHPKLRPKNVEWAMVLVNGQSYEYSYTYYCDLSTGHVGLVQVDVKGEIVSVNPPQVREVIKSSSTKGIRIPGETAPFQAREGTVQCIFEWKLK